MNPTVASLVYAIGIAGLFYLNHDKSVRTSKALWLPVIYIWLIGSRPVSFWLNGNVTSAADVQAQLDGSPIDAAVFGVLLIGGLCVLVFRGDRVLRCLIASWPILFYFSFCLLSVTWSDFQGIALKRWIKATGDLVMVLIVLTDRQPLAALGRLFSRAAFILLPISVLFCKYYPGLGRQYDVWSGQAFYTGITMNKNILGGVTFVLSLGALWRVLALLRSDKNAPFRRRMLLAQGIALAVGIYLLEMADSVTSSVSFTVAAVLMLAANLRFVRRYPSAIHALVFSLIMMVGFILLMGGRASMTHALGRESNLTGRTDIWAAVIPLCPNPVIGAGFESFWLSTSVHTKLWYIFPGLPLNEAHDGYIELYLELGWLGVCLIAFLLIEGYRRSVAAFRRDPAWGGLLIAYIVSAAVFNITEAGFRMMATIWVFLLFALVAASGIVSGVVVGSSGSRRENVGPVSQLPAKGWAAARQVVKGA
jgi:exopolysaccharide production protein ExoQ